MCGLCSEIKTSDNGSYSKMEVCVLLDIDDIRFLFNLLYNWINILNALHISAYNE